MKSVFHLTPISSQSVVPIT